MIGRGTNVWITGGSRGLGAGLARVWSRRGARVAITARDADALEATAAEIRAAGGFAVALPGDVAAKEAAHPLAARAQAALGGVQVLGHAASALGPVPLKLLGDIAVVERGRCGGRTRGRLQGGRHGSER